MPSYNSNVKSNSPVPALSSGNLGLILFNEKTTALQVSQQVAITDRSALRPPSVSLEFNFPSDPGVFEFDILNASTDLLDNYILVPVAGQVISAQAGPNGTFSARVELSPFLGNFLAVQCVTPNANNVNSIVRAFLS